MFTGCSYVNRVAARLNSDGLLDPMLSPIGVKHENIDHSGLWFT